MLMLKTQTCYPGSCSGTDNCRALLNRGSGNPSQENCIAVFGSNQVSAEGVLAANANLNVLGSDPANGDVVGVGFRCWFYHQSSC